MQISTTQQLYRALVHINRRISPWCKNCEAEDCEGQIWTLPEDRPDLLKAGVPLLKICSKNHRQTQVVYNGQDSKEFNKQLSFPLCRYRDQSGSCSIYRQRPFPCRLYPALLRKKTSRIWVTLSEECPFAADKMESETYCKDIRKVFDRLSPSLRGQLRKTYHEYDFFTGRDQCKSRFLFPL